MANVYSAQFFGRQCGGSFASAAIILPLLVDIFRPRSLVDIGCGQGMWSKAALGLGLEDQVGVDGAWVKPTLSIPEEKFRTLDPAAPFDLGRRFDLALSMDLGGDIAPARAGTFINNIVRHADAAVISAAAPGQGGVRHVSEEWPDYWASKFAARDFRCFDFLRRRIWNDRRIAAWHRQNLMIFASRRNAALIHRLETHAAGTPPAAVTAVHPEIQATNANSKTPRLRGLIEPLLRALAPRAKRPPGAPVPGAL